MVWFSAVGGARGAAHIGAIKVLEQRGIPIDYIAGTSMGAIVGGLYAAGYSVEQLEQILEATDWRATFDDDQPRQDRSFRRKLSDENFLVKFKPGLKDGKIVFPQGLVQGQKLTVLLDNLTAPVSDVNDFDALRIPFRAVATDLSTGQAVILGDGDLATAIRASMSVPGALEPIEIDGRVLVDGGVSNNLPMDVARDMGADALVVVSIGSPLKPAKELGSPLAVTEQLTTIMTQQNTQAQIATLSEADVLIEPDLGDIGTFSFTRVMEAVPLGAEAADEMGDELSRLSLAPDDHRRYLLGLAKPDIDHAPQIDAIRLDNQSRLDDRVLLAKLRIKPGDRLDIDRLNEDLAAIYGLDVFERVDYFLETEGEQTVLVVRADEKDWGPNYLEFGFGLEDSIDGSTALTIGTAFTMSNLDGMGSEWRTELVLGDNERLLTEFYKPLDPERSYFLLPKFEFRTLDQGIFPTNDNDPLAVVRTRRIDLSLNAGKELGTWGEIRAGIYRGFGDNKRRVGTQSPSPRHFDSGGYTLRFATDTVDNLYFPGSGHRSKIRFEHSQEALGADENFKKLELKGDFAKSWGRHTVIPGVELGGALSGEFLFQDLVRLGGFLRLSGLARNQLTGQYIGLGRVIYRYSLADDWGPFSIPVYLGGSMEFGNTWDDESDISLGSLRPAASVFAGADTFFGPLYLAGGLGDGGNTAIYLFLGNIFKR